ncbi:hypothetical protein LguiB_013485 [Lonicera macranthoides]
MSNSSASASASAADPLLLVGEYEVFLNFCGIDTRYGFTDYLYTSLHGAGVRTFRDDNELRIGEEIGPELDEVLEFLKQNNKQEDLDLVGMPSRIKKMEELLNIHSNGVRFIVIHGMGGLGKTTIAEESKKIKDAIHGKKVLIVLDDVNENFQIERLVGSWKWFDERARIIITTRNIEVLCALKRTCHGHPEVYGSYQPDYLDANESLELFSKHAFMSKSPPEGYDTISKEVVSTAAGLPLVLKVTGSSLYGETDEELWQEKIKELKNIPAEEVQEKLRLSYDPLSDAQKEIFLDIACLFIGQDKTNPCYMWDDCGFYPRNVLNILIRKSLITVGDDDILRMHDQLRDLGRHIACEGKLDEWGRWSRLWDCDKAFEVYRTGQGGTEIVKALCLDRHQIFPNRLEHFFGNSVHVTLCHLEGERFNPRHLEGVKFLRLPNLRYLTLDALDTLYGDFEHCLPNLRWLQWRNCSLKSITPTNLQLRNLVILDLSFTNITEKSKLWNQIQMSKKLKILDVSVCDHLRRVPCLSTFLNLERLLVHGCVNLCSLDGVEELESLRQLDASCCYSLKTLPSLSRLTKLKELKVESCNLITDFLGLDKLESLELLCMKNCESLERLPNLSNVKRLKELDASGVILTEIRGLGKLKSLEVLDMSYCENIEIVFGLINLKRLKRLNIQCCSKLIDIHGLEGLESLGCLVMDYCKSIETLPELSKLKSLKALSVRKCEKLTEIGGLEELISLEYLDIGYCKLIEHLPDFSNLRKLEVINATGCVKLTEIWGIENLETFGDLFINECESLNTLMYSHISRIRMHMNSPEYNDLGSGQPSFPLGRKLNTVSTKLSEYITHTPEQPSSCTSCSLYTSPHWISAMEGA